MTTTPISVRISRSAAGLAVTLWAAKAVVIGLAGGLDKSRLESPLFLAGLLAFVVAVVTLGVALTHGRPTWQRIVAAGVLAPAVGIGCTALVGSMVASVQPADPSWFWAEINLWVIAPLALVAAWFAARQRRGARGSRLTVRRVAVKLRNHVQGRQAAP